MARFLIDNKIDSAYLSSNNPMYPGLPLDYVKVVSKSYVARTTTNSATIITGSLSGVYPLSAFVIFNHNFTEGVEYKLDLFSTNDTGLPPDYTTGTLSVGSLEAITGDIHELNSLPIYFPEILIKTFQLTLINSIANPISYFQIYRLFTGNYIEPEIGVSLNSNIYWQTKTKQYRTDAGTLRSDVISPSKTIEFRISPTNETDRVELQRTLSSIGKRTEFFIDLFHGCSGQKPIDYRGLVKLKRVPKFTEFAENYYRSNYIVEEV